ncbi:chitinase [Murinocardiopsis flavida]|uniref:chitinase n=1 Tax=Murinocardiopsis flavida TaxID=645275 RepID=A0A2P8D2E5_9ACTN|nr:glycoside hydrolase family 18 protein [Murinocardiopsis flavida]PSK91369.1 chitinase [Murinocardiopsis flavida]
MSAQQRRRHAQTGNRRKSALLGVAVAMALGTLFFSAFTVISASGGSQGEPPGGRRIAYFADWNTANRGYTIKDVEESGAAARLTRLMWAFGNVNAKGRCAVSPEDDQPWAIYQRRYSAEESVDGKADRYEQPLAGSLNQLRKLRERRPELQTSISLGNWNWSKHFSDAARSEKSRAALVSSCIDLWLRGDLPKSDGEPQGGKGAAEGVFDGIDLDWEWPGGGGKEGNTERPEDKRNFTLLVEEFRGQLDDLEEQTGREYSLSASLTHDEELMRAGYEPEVFASLDFATVQGYDFTGSYSSTTDHHSQLFAPDGAPGDTGADRAVRQYLDYGLPADKLVLGYPAFGRGWRGVDPEGFGRYAEAESHAKGGYGTGTDAYADLEKRSGTRFLDPVHGTYWILDGDEWWTYDTPEVVAQKGAYVRGKGLGGLMQWNLDMDPEAELVKAMDDALDGG